MAHSTPSHIRLAKHYTPDPETGCWNWNGSLSTQGLYPTFTDAYGNIVYAYRFVYEQAYGPIPADHHVHHKCRNKLCVNPSHLEALSPEEHRAHHRVERENRIARLLPICTSLMLAGRTIDQVKKVSGVPKYALKQIQHDLELPTQLPVAA